MTDVLLALLRLAGFVMMSWGLGALLAQGYAAIERRLHARASRLPQPNQRPCARLFSPRIPCRDPSVTRVGDWMLACSQWSPLHATCKAIGSGSPND